MNETHAQLIYRYFCKELANIRKNKNISQEEASFELNISASYLSRIENNKLKNFPFVMCIMMCDFYGVELEDVYKVAKNKMRLDQQYL
jgi:transcriptional regulator with XRE-family HTH domain